ncbi:MAG: lysine biosynthesis protein LysX [Acidilobaceae archaeon]
MARIGIVYDVARWEERALVEAARRRGVSLEILYLKNSPLSIGAKSINLEVALQRSVSHEIALASTIALESSDVRVVNTSLSTAIARNKLWTLTLLASRGIETPRTYVAFDEKTALEAARKLGYPVVIKPIDGSWGRLVSLISDDESLRSIIEHRSYVPDPRFQIHLIQEFIRKPGRDLRVFVVGSEAPVAIYRVSEHWITNTARGGRAEPARVDSDLRELAIKVAEIIGVEIAGIDVFEDPERGYVVNEVNVVPDFKNTVAVTGYDLPGKIIEYLVAIAKR